MPHVKHGLGWPRIAQLAITQKTINQYYRRTDSSHRSQALFFMGHFALQSLLNGYSPIGCFYRCVVAYTTHSLDGKE